jgi:hypothetical protein
VNLAITQIGDATQQNATLISAAERRSRVARPGRATVGSRQRVPAGA